MGKENRNQNHDPIGIQSSIALLQERFKQLQRMKEKREERELLRKLEEPKQQPSELLFFHFLPLPKSSSSSSSSPPRQVPDIPLWSGSQQSTFRCMEAPPFGSFLESPTVTETASSTLHVSLKKLDETSGTDDDVDTSLHL